MYKWHKNKWMMVSALAVIFAVALAVGCPKGGLVPGPSGELTEKDKALDKYYQALRWRNNTVANAIANIKLLAVEDQKAWVMRVDPIKSGMDTALTAWKIAIDSENYEDLNANRDQFKALKNELLDVLVDLAAHVG